MSAEQLSRLVEWTVADPSAGRTAGRALGGLLHVVSTVMTLGGDAGTGARRPTWDVPADPDGYLDLGAVELRLPATARAVRVQATPRTVWTTPAGRSASRVPVETFRIVEAVPRNRAERDAEAPWTLTVTDGVQTGSLSGAWLALAWIGHLARWPEPDARRG
jgi:hypothetical protein